MEALMGIIISEYTDATLAIPRKGNSVWLAKRKVQPFLGDLSGWGGKCMVENDVRESPRVAAVREWEEETHTKTSLEYLSWFGVLFAHRFVRGVWSNFRVHLYVVKKWQGEIEETREMGPPLNIMLDQPHMYPTLRREVHLMLRFLSLNRTGGISIHAYDCEDGTSQIYVRHC
jgi:ADP-ribose pyrophosphatase YjhB (NUDIX family)